VKHIKPFDKEDKLDKHVRCWINSKTIDGGYDGVERVIEEVLLYGCQSGVVSELIYYRDTAKFLKKYAGEINGILSDRIYDAGLSVSELFGSKWDKQDPLARDTQNQNLLAWFGFEETCRDIAYRLSLDI